MSVAGPLDEDELDLELDPLCNTGKAGKRWELQRYGSQPACFETSASVPPTPGSVKDIEDIWSDLQQTGTQDGVDPTPSERFERQLQASLRNPADFRPGLLAEKLPTGRHFFSLANSAKPFSVAQCQVLEFLEQGVKFEP
ncbi:hypothetical protein Vretimale_17484 [Volvox reticuliferus]|uniref:Uncharacterized protein n=1 Tax=Volvox reticuliferus TaxID=1737510 RepID=A0A8J4LYF3_9CHLO|nr:hypothetical protein Vretimale_17484 [Volvox reticuliferus]